MFKQVYMGGFEVLNKIEKGLPTENTKHKMEEHQNKISDKADFNYLALQDFIIKFLRRMKVISLQTSRKISSSTANI
jgi:hypothetical protein